MEDLLVVTAKRYLPFLEKILNESDENEINNDKNGDINNRNNGNKISNLKLLARFKSGKKNKKAVNSNAENEECSSLEVDEVRTYIRTHNLLTLIRHQTLTKLKLKLKLIFCR